MIFGSQDLTSSAGILAFKLTQDNGQNIVGCCYADTNTNREFLVSQFTDTDSFSNLESLIVQLSPKVGPL